MKHTPGPWSIAAATGAGNDRIIIESYDFGAIAAISKNGAPRHQDRLSADSPYYQGQIMTMEANAQLIVAAPDLYEACKEVMVLVAKALPKFNWGASFLDAESIRLLNEVPSLVRQAIAKAEKATP